MKTIQIIFTFLIAIITTGAYAQEPNENYGQAYSINVGETITEYILEAGDRDYYKFNITEPGMIKLQILNVPENIDLDAFITNPLPLQENIRINNNPNNGQGYSLAVSTCKTGEHYVNFRDGGLGTSGGSDFSAEPYSFRIDFIPFTSMDLYECNNESISQAKSTSFGTVNSAVIAPRFDDAPLIRDKDYYKFDVTEPGMIKFQLLNSPDNLNIQAFIYDNFQEEIRRNWEVEQGDIYSLSVSTCDVGDHYLYLQDGAFSTNDLQGNGYNCNEQYSFKVDFIPFSSLDTFECENGSFNEAKEIISGDTSFALIVPWFDDSPLKRDKDYYKLNITEPGMIKFQLLSVPDNLNIDAFIYNSEQDEIRKNWDAIEGQGYTLWLSTCNPGDFFFYLRDGSSNGSSGAGNGYNCDEQYSFKIDFLPFSTYDSLECDNGSISTASPINLCDPIAAVIAPTFDDQEKDRDYYSVFLEEGIEYCFSLESVPTSIAVANVFIYGPGQQTLLAILQGGPGQTINHTFEAEESGDHVISLSASSFSPEEQYLLEVCACDVVSTAGLFVENPVFSLFPNPFDEQINITVDSTEPQKANVTIYDVFGKLLHSEQKLIENTTALNTQSLPSGILIVNIRTNYGQQTIKVLKQ